MLLYGLEGGEGSAFRTERETRTALKSLKYRQKCNIVRSSFPEFGNMYFSKDVLIYLWTLYGSSAIF
jgi:hypothetical protein